MPFFLLSVYAYFQVYLINAWIVLGRLPDKVDDEHLGSIIYPSIITDFALSLRRDNALAPHPMRGPTKFVVFVLIWALTPLVMLYFWIRSLPAHDELMTWFIGLTFILTVSLGIMSWQAAIQQLRRPDQPATLLGMLLTPYTVVFVVLVTPTMTLYAWEATEGGLITNREWLVRADVSGTDLVPRPQAWHPFQYDKEVFALEWCTARTLDCKSLQIPDSLQLNRDWKEHRAALRANLAPLGLGSVDLQEADMTRSFLAGANFRAARLDKAKFSESSLEAADLRGAHLTSTEFWRTHLEEARLQGANLGQAKLNEAYLMGANLSCWKEKDFSEETCTELEAAELCHADLRDADLRGANLTDTYLVGANISGANLSGAKGLTQGQLAQVVGDVQTRLPFDAKSGKPLQITTSDQMEAVAGSQSQAAAHDLCGKDTGYSSETISGG